MKGRYLAVKFRLLFGVWPESHSEEDRAVAQIRIDHVLHARAQNFLWVCEDQEFLRRLYNFLIRERERRRIVEDVLDFERDKSTETRYRIKLRKARFWDAHGVAKHFGYSVGKRAKDYLPEGWFRDIPEPEPGQD